jgi:pentatricopeptide repeat protein
MMVPTDYFTLAYLCGDLGLFVGVIIGYWALPFLACPRKSSKKSLESCDDEQCTEHANAEPEDTLPDHSEGENVATEEHKEPQFDVEEHVRIMEKFASERNLGGTMRTFRLIQKSGMCLSSTMYTIVLRACINCGNIYAAQDWMDETMEAKMADTTAFGILIKALVKAHALTKAKDLLRDMKKAGIKPSSATFNEVLAGFVREGSFNESLSLIEQMPIWGVQASDVTRNAITKLINESRHMDGRCGRVLRILERHKLVTDGIEQHRLATSVGSDVPVPLPELAAVLSVPSDAKEVLPAPYSHEVQVTGSLPQVKAARKSLKRHGFLDKSESEAWPLDGHWETDRGLTVVIEGKIVRWSNQRASRLRFTKDDRSACILALYGEPANGHIVSPPLSPDARKTLMWDNGDVWHSYDGRVIGQDMMYLQRMTKIYRDNVQDKVYQARSNATIKCVSKHGLGFPVTLEAAITQFLGTDMYRLSLRFVSKWNPTYTEEEDDELPLFEKGADICESISRRHPQVGLRHCWVESSLASCGQRTIVNGQEVDEHCFNRHLGTVRWA